MLAVNVSARNLRDEAIVDRIFGALAVHDLDPSRLVVEITETSFAADRERASAIVSRLRAGGVGVSLDDFGQGYTSLGFLRDLPISELKIDRRFVAGMQASAEDRAIVSSVIELGHQLGLTVVAEGVETWAEATELEELACDAVQGFLYGVPAPADDVVCWFGDEPVAPVGVATGR